MAPIPRYIVVSSWLAGGVGAVQALIWAILCCVALVTYDSCSEETPVSARGYFFHVLKTHYLKGPNCGNETLFEDGLLDAERVRIWAIVSLSFSLLWLVVSAGLLSVADTSDEVPQKAFQPFAYTWTAATLAVTAIDITAGTLFAIDYTRLNNALSVFEGGSPAAYPLDMLRLGAYVMMTLTLKGYVLLIMNIALAVVIAVFGYQAGEIIATSEHSVHSRGVLRAYSTPANKQDDPWRQQQNYDSMMFERGSHLNRGFDASSARSWLEPPTPPAPATPAPLSADINSRAFDRSDSWHPVRQGAESSGSRPFSYLEEPRRGAPAPVPVLPPWQRPWDQPPPLPAPDYSPKQTRKLKSALKPNY